MAEVFLGYLARQSHLARRRLLGTLTWKTRPERFVRGGVSLDELAVGRPGEEALQTGEEEPGWACGSGSLCFGEVGQ